jgi:hypothetical protein
MVHHGGGVWLAGDSGKGAVLISSDAIHWTVQHGYTTGRLGYTGRSWISVTDAALDDGRCLAVLTSRFGRTWTSHRLPALLSPENSTFFWGLEYGEGRWVGLANDGLVLCAEVPHQGRPRLRLEQRDRGDSVLVSCAGPTGHVYRLEASDDLIHWRERAVGHGDLFEYPVGSPRGTVQQFYRVVATPLTDLDDGKHQVQCLGDPFLSAPAGDGRLESRWIKFAILLDQPDRVYFQDSSKYLFHDQFARQRLPPCVGMSLVEFEQVSLHTHGQRVVLGSVISPPDPILPEIGIQFVGLDPYPADQLAEWFELVRGSIAKEPEVEVFLMPLPVQEAEVIAHAADLAARGIPVASASRWVQGDQVYSEGWALGRIRYVPGAAIDAAYRAGRLQPVDILLTDAVPAEVPPVAGILCTRPATPNAHVAILARSFGIPFAYLHDETVRRRLRDWDGLEIALVTRTVRDTAEVNAVLVEGQLTPEQRARILAAKRPRLAIVPKAHRGQISVATAGLVPEDIRHVGGKAANFGFLVRSVPDHAPTEALALTLDLWDQFLDQTLASGKTLRQTIRNLLSVHAYPPETRALAKDLDDIRDLIRREAKFSPEQQQTILAALAGFDRDRNIRFRSSTNVEDTERFSGAGLYDSYSGCLADDLDADERGPSHCDPTEANERGVFRAIQRVYASFYNDNAVLERLRHGVNEDDVGMAVLVHYAVPDRFEWANGVATLTLTEATDPGRRHVEAELVTQAGAVSVANPATAALPEIVTARRSGNVPLTLQLSQRSGLVQLGATVLDWPSDYESLFGLLDTAARAYVAHTGKEKLVLDFEYKKVEPGRLVLKQLREIPRLDAAQTTPPFLLGEPSPYTVLQYSECNTPLFSNHRLKSIWQFQSFQPAREGGAEGPDFDLTVDVQYLEGQEVKRYLGRMSGLPGAQILVRSNRVTYSWVWGPADSRRDCLLTLTFPYAMEGSRIPCLVLRDAVLVLAVRYASPQVGFHVKEGIEPVAEERAVLVPGWNATPVEATVAGRFARGGVTVEYSCRFSASYLDSYPLFLAPGPCDEWYTSPLIGFEPTTITGLSSKPIVLRGHFSQSFSTTHHNRQRNFIFEPALEPGIDPGTLAELRAANIKAIVAPACTREFSHGCEERTLMLWGLDDTFRQP